MTRTERERLEELASGFMHARIVITAVELDLFTAVGREGIDAAEAARRTGAVRAPLERLMNALAALGLLRKRKGVFRNSPAALRHLTANAPEPLRHITLHRARMWESWSRLTSIVRTGRVPPRKRTPEGEEQFIRGMADVARTSAVETARVLHRELRGARRLLDVGGGPALYACAFARRRPGLSVTVLDLPGPLRIARETIRAAGLGGRVKARAADVLQASSLGRGYDMVFMSNLIHSFKRPDARAVVHKAAAALKPGGRLAVKEFYIRQEGTAPPFAALFSINMLVAAAGDCFTREEVEGWMEEAGVRPSAFHEVAAHSGILVGVKRGSRA